MTEIVYTPYSRTPVIASRKWEDKTWCREYQMYRRREKIGLKQRPRLCVEEGVLYREKHPECVITSYYKPAKVIACPVCEKEMKEGYFEAHIKSKKHVKNLLKSVLISTEE